MVTGASLERLVSLDRNRIEKGEPWIKVSGSQEIAIGRLSRPVVLIVAAVPRDAAMEAIDETTDPRKFIKKAIEKLN